MGGATQFVAGIIEFCIGNTFGSTVHCLYGAFWLSYTMFLILSLDIECQYNGDKQAYTFALAIYHILWCFFTLVFIIAALRKTITIILIFFFLVLAFLFLNIANFIATEHPAQNVQVNKAGSAFMVICALIAFYAGAPGLMLPETTFICFPLGEIP